MAGRPRPLYAQWQFWAKVAGSVAIAALFAWRSQAEGVDLLPDLEHLGMLAAAPWGVAGCLVALLLVHFFRAYRWAYLLKPLATAPITTWEVLTSAFVGFLAIIALPLRTGEVARPYLIAARGKVSMSAAFGTIAIERVIDGVVLSAALTLCLLLIPLQPGAPAWVRSAGVATLGLFLAAAAVLVLMLWKGEPAVDWLERLGATIWPGFARKVADVLREFVHGLAALPDRTHLVPFVLMTLVYWGINGLGMWVLALGCGLPITLVGAFTVMTLLAVGILIPAGPGQLGNFQYAVAVALAVQLPASQLEPGRSVYIFAMFLLMQGLTLVAGVGSLLTRHVSLARAPSTAAERAPEPEGTP